MTSMTNNIDRPIDLDKLLRHAVDLTIQAMDRSTDGCEGGWVTERTGKMCTEAETYRERGEYLEAWFICEQWLVNHS